MLWLENCSLTEYQPLYIICVMEDILYITRRSGYRVRQIPVRWWDGGDSRLGFFAGNIRNVKDIFNV